MADPKVNILIEIRSELTQLRGVLTEMANLRKQVGELRATAEAAKPMIEGAVSAKPIIAARTAAETFRKTMATMYGSPSGAAAQIANLRSVRDRIMDVKAAADVAKPAVAGLGRASMDAAKADEFAAMRRNAMAQFLRARNNQAVSLPAIPTGSGGGVGAIVQQAAGAIPGVGQLGSMLGGMGGVAAYGAIAAAVVSATAAGIRYNAVLERNEMSFRTLLGTAEKAQERMAGLVEFAAKTPFELPEVIEASRLLQALSGDALASGDGLKIVGDAAAGLGKPIGEVAMWIGRLYAGLDSGTPVGEATLRLIELGAITGPQARRLNELAESGKGVGRAFNIISAEFSKYRGAMSAQAETWDGIMSTLRDTLAGDVATAAKPIKTMIQDLATAFLELRGAMQGVREEQRHAGWARVAQAIQNAGEVRTQSQLESSQAAIDTLLAKRREELARKERGGYDAGTFEADYVLGQRALAAKNAGIPLENYTAPDEVPLWNQVKALEMMSKRLREEGAKIITKNTVEDLKAANDAVNEESSQWLSKNGAEIRSQIEAMRARNLPVEEQIRLEELRGKQLEMGRFLALQDAAGSADASRIELQYSLAIETSRERLVQLGVRKAQQDKQASAAEKQAQEDAKRVAEEYEREMKQRRQRALEAVNLDTEKKLGELQNAQGEVQGAWYISDREQRTERIRLMRVEVGVLEDHIRKLEELRDAAPEEERQTYEGQIIGARSRVGSVKVGIQQQGPDPESVGEQTRFQFQQLENQLATFSENMGVMLTSPIAGFRDGFATALDDLLAKGATAGEFFGNIARGIGQSMRQAFVKMATDFIMQHAVMKVAALAWNGFLKLLRWADVIDDAAAEKARMGPKIANATLSSISSFGVAAAIGVAAIAGILAAVGAFAEGGLTPGRPTLAWVGEEGPELVIPAPATARFSPQQRAMLMEGKLPVVPGDARREAQAPASVEESTRRITALIAFAQGGLTPGKPTMAWVGERGPELVLPANVTGRFSPEQQAMLMKGQMPAIPMPMEIPAADAAALRPNLGVMDVSRPAGAPASGPARGGSIFGGESQPQKQVHFHYWDRAQMIADSRDEIGAIFHDLQRSRS